MFIVITGYSLIYPQLVIPSTNRFPASHDSELNQDLILPLAPNLNSMDLIHSICNPSTGTYLSIRALEIAISRFFIKSRNLMSQTTGRPAFLVQAIYISISFVSEHLYAFSMLSQNNEFSATVAVEEIFLDFKTC